MCLAALPLSGALLDALFPNLKNLSVTKKLVYFNIVINTGIGPLKLSHEMSGIKKPPITMFKMLSSLRGAIVQKNVTLNDYHIMILMDY
jgi:hypothetical protein